jgi:hypothetical protein
MNVMEISQFMHEHIDENKEFTLHKDVFRWAHNTNELFDRNNNKVKLYMFRQITVLERS